MKKLLLIIFVASIMLFGCTQNEDISVDDLPPAPSEPSVSPIGQAGGAASNYAPNNNNINFPNELIYSPTDDSQTKTVIFSGKELIYKKGYYLKADNSWIAFSITGDALIGDWVKNPGSSSFFLAKPNLGDSSAIIMYGCSKVSGAWSCNWVAKEFNVIKKTACTDPDGETNSGFNVKGTTTGKNSAGQTGSFVDTCSNGKVSEHSCSNYVVVSSLFDCPSGKYCNDGTCRVKTCTDTGNDLFVREVLNYISDSGTTNYRPDICASSGVNQYYCDGSIPRNNITPCPDFYTCSNGACVQDIPSTPINPNALNLNLVAGYNYINIPIALDSPRKLSAIKLKLGSSFDGFYNPKYGLTQPLSDFSKYLGTDKGVVVKLKNAKTLTYTEPLTTKNGISVCIGENSVGPDVCVGYNTTQLLGLSQLEDIDKMDSTWISNHKIPSGEIIGNPFNLEKGSGYLINSNTNGIITCANGQVSFVTMSTNYLDCTITN